MADFSLFRGFFSPSSESTPDFLRASLRKLSFFLGQNSFRIITLAPVSLRAIEGDDGGTEIFMGSYSARKWVEAVFFLRDA